MQRFKKCRHRCFYIALVLAAGAMLFAGGPGKVAKSEDTLDRAIEEIMPVVCEHMFVRLMGKSSVRDRAAYELDRKYERFGDRFDQLTVKAAIRIAVTKFGEKGSCPIAGWIPEKALPPEVVNQRNKEIAMAKEWREMEERDSQCRRSCPDNDFDAQIACLDGCTATRKAEVRAFDERWK